MSTETELIRQQSSRFLPARVVAETGSTNSDLMEEALRGAPEGVVLVTDHQTSGRGRQGRTWFDEPESALLVSWLLRPSGYRVGLIPLITGMAVVDVLNGLGAQTVLKWPNDVLASSEGSAKIAGILAEASTSIPTGSTDPALHVVVGLGLNLAFTVEPEAGAGAVDLQTLIDKVPPKLELLDAILVAVDDYLTRLERGDDAAVRAAYAERCETIARDVRFETPVGEVIGRGAGIDESGALMIRTASGIKTVSAGDAHHL